MVGTASARLLASGTPRRDRLDALSLLGLLIDHADGAGSVRLPFDTLVGEFGVAPERGRELLEALMAVEVVQTVGDGVAVAGPPPAHAGAFRLSAFLANVTKVLDHGGSVRPSSSPTPLLISSPSLVPRRGRRGEARFATGVLPRVLAGAAAALVVMWSTASPSGEPTAVRTVAGPSSSTGRAPWATTPTTALTADAPDPIRDDPSPPASPAVPVAPSVPTPEEDTSPTGRPEPAPSTREDTAETSSDPAPPTRRSLAPGSPQIPWPSPRAPLPPTRAGPIAPPGNIGATCPVGEVEASVVDTRLLPVVAPGLLDVGAAPDVEVRGTLRNLSDAALVVRSFLVSVDGNTPANVAGSPAPLALPAGGGAGWRVVLPPAMAAPTLSLVEVHILDWSWTDPLLEARCPG